MKNTLKLAVILAAFSSSAVAADYYTSISVSAGKSKFTHRASGVGELSDLNIKSFHLGGMGADLAFGAFLTPEVRTEVAFGMLKSGDKRLKFLSTANYEPKYSVNSYYGMVNSYYDFNLGGMVSPYLMAGIGYGKDRAAYKGSEDADNVIHLKRAESKFKYQVGAGFSFKISEGSLLDIGYRFKSAEDIKFKGNYKDEGTDVLDKSFNLKSKFAHVATVGLRFEF